jgi:hypothetical protein
VAVSNSWLDWGVAIVTVATLIFLLVWRIRDSQTRLKMEVFRVVGLETAQPVVVFNVINKSKFAVLLDNPRLLDEAEQQEVRSLDGSSGGNRVEPEHPMRYRVPLMELLDTGAVGELQGDPPVLVKFVIEDGTRKRHAQAFVVKGLGSGRNVTVSSPPLPFYKR